MFESYWQNNIRITNSAVNVVVPQGYVHCQRLTETLFFAGGEKGHVRWGLDGVPEKSAFLTWDTCQDLFSWMRSDKQHPTLGQVVAVHVLVHETIHMAGEKSENRTECAALLWDSVIAQKLGASKAQGDSLAQKYWLEMYPKLANNYRSTDCAPGGVWDPLPELDGGGWPNGRTVLGETLPVPWEPKHANE